MRRIAVADRHKITVVKDEEKSFVMGCVCGHNYGINWSTHPISQEEKERIRENAKQWHGSTDELRVPLHGANYKMYGPHNITISADEKTADCTCGWGFRSLDVFFRTKNDAEVLKIHNDCLQSQIDQEVRREFDGETLGH